MSADESSDVVYQRRRHTNTNSRINKQGEVRHEVVEVEEDEPEVVREISYSQAKKLRPKREMSDKQREAVRKLCELNKMRHEEKVKARRQEEVLKEIEEENNRIKLKKKLIRMKTVVKPKREYKASKVSKKQYEVKQDTTTTDNTSDDDTTDTDIDAKGKLRYQKKIHKLKKKLKTVKEEKQTTSQPQQQQQQPTHRDVLDRFF